MEKEKLGKCENILHTLARSIVSKLRNAVK